VASLSFPPIGGGCRLLQFIPFDLSFLVGFGHLICAEAGRFSHELGTNIRGSLFATETLSWLVVVQLGGGRKGDVYLLDFKLYR